MSREMIKEMIDHVPESQIEAIYNMVVRLIPEEKPYDDEVKALVEAAENSETIAHSDVDWS